MLWEHTIRNENDYVHHADYVHLNSMKYGLVEKLTDWPYSSFHRYVWDVIYPENWAGGLESWLEINERE